MEKSEIDKLIANAAKDDGEAMFELAQYYRDGYGVKLDFDQFLELLTKLRKRIGLSAKIKSLLGFKGRPPKELEKFVAWLKGSVANHPKHISFLAIMYWRGIGMEKDLKQWIEWLNKAINAGDAWSMGALALAYRNGLGVDKNLNKWLSWLHKAITAGDSWSMGELAWAYKEGIGVQKNQKTSTKWLHKASDAGDAWSMGALALAYRDGLGVGKNLNTWLSWLKKASAAGDSWSMGELAWAYKKGTGIQKNRKTSTQWLHKASDAGDVWSMGQLSLSIPNPEESIFFKKAKEGDKLVEAEIRRLYKTGEFRLINNNDDHIKWLSHQAVLINDANLYAELAFMYRERNKDGDMDEYQQCLKHIKDKHPKSVYYFVFEQIFKFSESQPDAINELGDNDLTSALFKLCHAVYTIKQKHLISVEDENIVRVAHFTTLEALHSMLPVPMATLNKCVCTEPAETNSLQVNELQIPFTDSTRTGELVLNSPKNKSANKETMSSKDCLLRLYNIAYMNDPQEGRRLLDIDHEDTKLLGTFFASAQQENKHSILWENEEFSIYCGSFTFRVDRLDLWRAYGSDGSGYCLDIPANTFKQELNINTPHAINFAMHYVNDKPREIMTNDCKPPALYRIRYRREEAEKALETLKPILEVLKELKKQEKIIKIAEQIDSLVRIIISDILYLYKNEEYASEEEARMIVAHNIADEALKLDDNQPPRIYAETNAFLFRDEGTRIIIGPKVADKVAAELNLKFRLARHQLLDKTSVVWSTVQYR